MTFYQSLFPSFTTHHSIITTPPCLSSLPSPPLSPPPTGYLKSLHSELALTGSNITVTLMPLPYVRTERVCLTQQYHLCVVTGVCLNPRLYNNSDGGSRIPGGWETNDSPSPSPPSLSPVSFLQAVENMLPFSDSTGLSVQVSAT